MIGEVSVVFHSAATIKFDEELTKAVNLNVVAVYTIIEICKRMKRLQVSKDFTIVCLIICFLGRPWSTCPLLTATHSASIFLRKFTQGMETLLASLLCARYAWYQLYLDIS